MLGPEKRFSFWFHSVLYCIRNTTNSRISIIQAQSVIYRLLQNRLIHFPGQKIHELNLFVGKNGPSWCYRTLNVFHLFYKTVFHTNTLVVTLRGHKRRAMNSLAENLRIPHQAAQEGVPFLFFVWWFKIYGKESSTLMFIVFTTAFM